MNDHPTDVGRGIAVIIATRGRAQLAADLVSSLAEQTRPPDAVFVIGSREEDVAGIQDDRQQLIVSVGRTGSATQRNDGLALAGSRFSTIVFFDDDFVPSRYWLETAATLFEKHPDIVSLTGRVLVDGIKSAGIPLAAGKRIVQLEDKNYLVPASLHDGHGPYGCNMAFRYSAIKDVSFDERLPLYAWLEDADFGGQIRNRGRLVRADALWGVHLGHKSGRGRGVALGYSQIANAVYLARKGTLPVAFVANIAVRNLLMNLARALYPESFIDRRGRLYGNLLAITDIARGRIRPERAAEL